jgi:hypothetical protein
MHQGIPHTSTATAAGYGALHALNVLAGAFGDHVPTKADFDAATRRLENVKVGGKPFKKLLPALLGDNPAAAKTAQRNLNRAIDANITTARKAEKSNIKSHSKLGAEKAKHARAVASDLKIISLYVATKFQSRALTNARAHGIRTAHPSIAHLAKLSSTAPTSTAKMTIGEEIPSGVPVASSEISYLGFKADEMAGDDFSEIGAALTAYAGACGCGYGTTADFDDNDGGIYDVDEDAQLFLLLQAPSATALADAVVVYPGAAKALTQGYATRSSQLAARAFSYLRKQRVSNADEAWSAPVGSTHAFGALRAMNAANTLILHWARKYYDRYMADLAQARGIKTSATPTSLQAPTAKQIGFSAAVSANPAMQLAASTAAKNEAASAAAAVIKASPTNIRTVAAAIGDQSAKKELAAAIKDYREALTKEILDEAAIYGRTLAQSNRPAATAIRKKLLQHLAQRRSIIVRELGLNAKQAQVLFALESQIMTNVADRAGHAYRMGLAKAPPIRARITAKISAADKRIADLRARRNTVLKFAKAVKPSSGLAGLMVDVGDAISDLGWAGVGLGAAGLVLGGALGSR